MSAARGKPVVSRKPEIVVSRILDAAQAEFMLSGFEAASTNRITAAFGGSKATIFRYFPTKEAMLDGVVRRIAGRWREAVVLDDIREVDPRQWLEIFASRALDWILSDEPLFLGRLGISEGHKIPSLTRVFERIASQPLQQALSQRLDQWTRAGRMDCPEPRTDAGHFMDLLVGGPVSRALYRTGDWTAEQQARHVQRGVEIFLRGCAAEMPAA